MLRRRHEIEEKSFTEGTGEEGVFYLLGRLVEKLEACFGEKLVSAVLFGSFARGDFHPLSDIDLLLGYRPLRDMGYLGRIVPVLKTPEEAFHR